MAQKWFQKATVQAGLAGGVFVVLAALITTLINRPDSTTPTEKAVYALGSADGGIGKYWQHLKYSFTRDEYVHPRIVEELLGWISDSVETITTIDLVEANDSNRFFGEVELRKVGEHTWVEHRLQNERGYFSYRYVGTSPSGIHILLCAENGGGSGVFMSVILLSLQVDTAIQGGADHIVTRERVLLHTMGSISLGDRYSGSVTYDRGVLTIGADESPMKHGGRLTRQDIPIE
ncbi:MAG: hypothetical protein WBC05_12875 [Sedimentisphaerales bacterium]